jgi:hypothetical protein
MGPSICVDLFWNEHRQMPVIASQMSKLEVYIRALPEFAVNKFAPMVIKDC